MRIRYAKHTDDLQTLWQVCFEDDGNVFFEHDFDPGRAIVMADDADVPAAMLHWMPQTLYLPGPDGTDGREVDAAYLLGIATRPERQGQGYAGALVQRIVSELDRMGMPAAFLLPCGQRMARFYQRHGFRPMGLCPAPVEVAPPDEAALKEITQNVAATLDALYERMYAPCAHPRRGWERWKRIAADYELRWSGGRYRVYDGDTLMEDSDARFSVTDKRPALAGVRVLRAGALPEDMPFAANLLYNERVD